MKNLLVGAIILAAALSPRQGTAARKTLHTRFFFSMGGGKSYWAETTPAPSALGLAGGWDCTAGTIELSQGLTSERVYRTAGITCLDKHGTEAEIDAMCDIAGEDRDSHSVRLQMKGDQPVHVEISCYTRRE